MSASQARSDIRSFFWLPKTAGGTLAAGIRGNTGVRWLGQRISPDAVPAPSSGQIWLAGHTNFGDHLIYNSKPVYFTILRDPIERLISEFFYHHQHRLPGVFIPDDEIVPSFIRLVEAAPHLNYFSYMFSDYCVEKEVAEQGLPSWNGDSTAGFNLICRRAERYGFLTENVVFQKVNVDRAFLRALWNIQSMRFVGFFDRVDGTIACLKGEFGLNVSLDMRLHETQWKPDLDELPSRVAAMLRQKTEADYELFHDARRAHIAAPRRRHRLVRAKGRNVSWSLLRPLRFGKLQ